MFSNKIAHRRIDRIVGRTTITTTAVPLAFNGKDIRLNNLAGNTWINHLGTALNTGVNSYQLTPGQILDINVDGTLSLVSDAGTSTVQIIVFE